MPCWNLYFIDDTTKAINMIKYTWTLSKPISMIRLHMLFFPGMVLHLQGSTNWETYRLQLPLRVDCDRLVPKWRPLVIQMATHAYIHTYKIHMQPFNKLQFVCKHAHACECVSAVSVCTNAPTYHFSVWGATHLNIKLCKIRNLLSFDCIFHTYSCSTHMYVCIFVYVCMYIHTYIHICITYSKY